MPIVVCRYSGARVVRWRTSPRCGTLCGAVDASEPYGVPALKFPISACLLVFATALQAAENPLRGKILFLRCASCHDVSTTQSAKIGPNLYGVVGRRAASQEGYPYSPGLRAQTFNWDVAHLDAWLTNPNDVAPGTAMAFAGIADEADRRAIISFLEGQHGGTP